MRHLLLAATALALLSGVAYAQDSSSTSGSSSTATNTSNSSARITGATIGNGNSRSNSSAVSNTRSTSRSASVGNSNTTTINVSGYSGVDNSGNSSASSASRSGISGGAGAGDPSAAGDPTSNIHYSGGYAVHNVPEVIPPNVVGGNPCAVGASGGLAVAGFGIAGGGTWADRACERRQQAALLFNMGEQKVALELMCQDDNVRSAMKLGGKPCSADVPLAQAPVAAAMAQAPPTVAVTPVTAVPSKPARPEWCYTASPAEQRAHAVCDLKS